MNEACVWGNAQTSWTGGEGSRGPQRSLGVFEGHPSGFLTFPTTSEAASGLFARVMVQPGLVFPTPHSVFILVYPYYDQGLISSILQMRKMSPRAPAR